MTTTEIIDRFYLQVDDSSELSDTEVLALANEVYGEIQDDRPWEWLKATKTGTTSISVPYVALPADFKSLVPNFEGRSVVFIGTDYQEYVVVPFSSRRQYRDQDGYCYLDMVNSRLYFTKQPTTANSYEYDYIMVAPDLDTSTSDPIFRAGQHQIISYGIAAKFNPIELTDKAQSYQRENTIAYNEQLSGMRLEDANIKLGIS